MIKTFFLMAILTMPNGEVKNHPHIGFEFKSLEECHSFLNKNALTISMSINEHLVEWWGYEHGITVNKLGCSFKYKQYEQQELFPDSTAI